MSPTLLELGVAIILVVVAWQIGVAIAPAIMRGLRSLKNEVDEAAEEAFGDLDQKTLDQQHKEEHTNGTRR
jgi:nitrogen fixation/metabolism regulation signal transduction histidine kinase